MAVNIDFHKVTKLTLMPVKHGQTVNGPYAVRNLRVEFADAPGAEFMLFAADADANHLTVTAAGVVAQDGDKVEA